MIEPATVAVEILQRSFVDWSARTQSSQLGVGTAQLRAAEFAATKNSYTDPGKGSERIVVTTTSTSTIHPSKHPLVNAKRMPQVLGTSPENAEESKVISR